MNDTDAASYPGLDERGYPIKKSSIIVAVRRELLPTLDFLKQTHAESTNPIIKISVRRYKQWYDLVGTVDEVLFFDDGIVVKFSPDQKISSLKWPKAAFWIPYVGTGGILADQWNTSLI
ncbi:MAG: hypothetical protein K9M11_00830 [Candidatus Pacebacteria bacterium]|nr:hypothetical protein [Candidatus Paceibacterota bacterium]